VAHRLVQVMVRHTAHPVGQFAHGRHAQIARLFGCTCDQLVCVFLSSLHTRPRVQRRPAFPAPSAC
jgi:hypothetical protein